MLLKCSVISFIGVRPKEMMGEKVCGELLTSISAQLLMSVEHDQSESTARGGRQFNWLFVCDTHNEGREIDARSDRPKTNNHHHDIDFPVNPVLIVPSTTYLVRALGFCLSWLHGHSNIRSIAHEYHWSASHFKLASRTVYLTHYENLNH